MQVKTLYETDFNLWLDEQVQALRAKELTAVDIENLIEEIAGLARSDKRTLTGYLKVLGQHLLKWQYQPQQRSGSWKASIRHCRFEIDLILEDSPSLRNFLPEALSKAYPQARQAAADETGLALEQFPNKCPYTLEALLNEDWLPE